MRLIWLQKRTFWVSVLWLYHLSKLLLRLIRKEYFPFWKRIIVISRMEAALTTKITFFSGLRCYLLLLVLLTLLIPRLDHLSCIFFQWILWKVIWNTLNLIWKSFCIILLLNSCFVSLFGLRCKHVRIILKLFWLYLSFHKITLNLRIKHPDELRIKFSFVFFLFNIMKSNACVRIHVQGCLFSAQKRPSSESIVFLRT